MKQGSENSSRSSNNVILFLYLYLFSGMFPSTCAAFLFPALLQSEHLSFHNHGIDSNKKLRLYPVTTPTPITPTTRITTTKITSTTNSRLKQSAANQETESPPLLQDEASTTPQLLAALWRQIAQGCKLTKGQSITVLYPQMEQPLSSSTYLELLMGHLDVCKDVCDDFGINTVLSPLQERIGGKNVVVGFSVKSYRDPNKVGTFSSDGDLQFAPDPYFDDDDWDILEEQIRAAAMEDEELDDDDDDDDDEQDGNENDENDWRKDLPDIVEKIPVDDDEIVNVSKKWVDKIMSDMGICPFTKGADMAGLPMGKVFYTVDRSVSVEDMYARYWEEVVRVEQMPEKDLSTTLLIAPEFLIDNIEMFENFSNTLTQPMETLQVENLIQLVFFHPEWTFRDGGERSGMGSAANYARRSPWPMINILRTKQVRAAQKGIPTGLVYQQNEKTLSRVGAKSLERMLRLRDWSEIADLKVDRKDMEALRVAQDLQTTGVIAEKDMSVIYDSTPAANKVNRQQIEGGNIVNVVLQALEKRLMGDEDGGILQLSGAETSAAMMASDFLLEYLESLSEMPQQKKIPVNPMAKAYFDIEEDEFFQSKVTEEDEGSILFGGGGIMTGRNDDSIFSNAADPRNFF